MFQKKRIAKIAHDVGSSEHGNRFGGGGFQDFISPKGLEKWKPSTGANKIDILPYNASSSHPLVVTGQAEEGDGLYSLDVYVHRDIGPSHKNIPCLKQFGKRCPLCEEAARLRNLGTDAGKDASSKLYARRRVVYVVHDLNTDKYGYWDTGFKSVEQKINAAAAFEVNEENGAKIDVFDWEEGKTIRFMGTEKSFNGNKYVEPDGFGFITRKPLTDDALNHSQDLSESLNMVSEEDMERLLSGEIVSNSSPKKVEEKPVEETYTDEEMPSQEDDLEPMNQPVKKAEPKPIDTSSEKPKVNNTCPFGHNWGEADSHDECATCDEWEKCID